MCKQHALRIAWTIARSIAFIDFRVLRRKFTYDWKCVNTTYRVHCLCPLPASRKGLRLPLRSALFGEGGRDWRPCKYKIYFNQYLNRFLQYALLHIFTEGHYVNFYQQESLYHFYSLTTKSNALVGFWFLCYRSYIATKAIISNGTSQYRLSKAFNHLRKPRVLVTPLSKVSTLGLRRWHLICSHLLSSRCMINFMKTYSLLYAHCTEAMKVVGNLF